jgi:hypothetical protein
MKLVDRAILIAYAVTLAAAPQKKVATVYVRSVSEWVGSRSPGCLPSSQVRRIDGKAANRGEIRRGAARSRR